MKLKNKFEFFFQISLLEFFDLGFFRFCYKVKIIFEKSYKRVECKVGLKF